MPGSKLLAHGVAQPKGNIFDSPDYWCGDLGYRPGPAGRGYEDFPIHQVKVDAILSMAPRGKILDVGCAAGYIVRRLRQRGFDAQGIDISQYAIETLAPPDVRPYLAVGDVRSLPFADQEFDLAFSSSVLEHLTEEEAKLAASEIARVAHRGIMAVCHTGSHKPGEDVTHRTIRALAWWQDLFPYAEQLNSQAYAHLFLVRSDATEDWLKDHGLKLNLGSFLNVIAGWRNIDILPLNPHIPPHVEFTSYDLRRGIPHLSQSAILINNSHLVEHLTYDEARQLLQECYRVLKPGGIMRVSTPDLKLLTKTYLAGQMDTFNSIQPKEYIAAPTQAEKFSRILFEGHKQAYDEERLVRELRDAGFADARRVLPGESLSQVMATEVKDQHIQVSAIVEGVK